MPHCQKEKHNHAARSKKERRRQREEQAARKKTLAEEKAAAEAEAALKLSNNIAPVEGHGQYEIGCEPEPEYTRFNAKKRSKKHLRQDARKAMLREKLEEEERQRKQQEEEYRQRLRALREANGETEVTSEEEEEEEEEPPVLEYFVFVCECCDKRYATKNQFLNHINSKKHKRKVRIWEELGLLVTHVELRGENGNEKELYDDYEDDNDDDDDESDNDDDDRAQRRPAKGGASDDESEEDESEDESDDEYVPPKKKNVFEAFAGFSSSSEDEDSESDNDSDSDAADRKAPPPARRKDPPPTSKKEDEKKDDDDDDINFDELIYQNQQIRNEIDAENTGAIVELPAPVPFHEVYDPDDYDVNENRLASVQHRLRRNLAARGIEPSARNAPSSYDPLEAITMGKTLLQQVLEANIDTLQQKLDAYRKHKGHCELMTRQFALAKGNSKALPSQFVYKQDAADNARRRANVHHAGSHYHMQAARSMQFGRRKGLMARHSSQGARLQASRMTAKETARMQQGGGGMKIGKTSKKSNQKRRGEAGGSKKSGGKKGGDGGGGGD
mmetsp:Transcript_23382/g.55364  ORF Transcript_23382/g.55364 Transcript_23382/m.55364 type:complete len:558 (-) Transcript_23382:147-1820(-)